MSNHDEKHLIAAAQRGLYDAFAKLYEQHHTSVFRFIHRKIARREDAEDVTTETWIAALHGLKGYTGQSSFKNWVFGIAKHKCMDYYRATYQLPTVAFIEELDSISEEKPEHDNKKTIDIHAVLSKLPERYREVLHLRFLKGLGTAEIARVMKLTITNVKVLQHRAIKKAQELYE